MKNEIVEFLIELGVRFTNNTPWFFRTLQIISGIIAIVLLGPDIIEAIEKGGFTLPSTWKDFVSKIVGYATLAATVIAQLTTTTDVKKSEQLRD